MEKSLGEGGGIRSTSGHRHGDQPPNAQDGGRKGRLWMRAHFKSLNVPNSSTPRAFATAVPSAQNAFPHISSWLFLQIVT